MEFWKSIEQMNFNERGYEEAGRWLVEDSGLKLTEIKQVEEFARKKADDLYDKLFDVTGVADDAYDDLLWQIVANGEEFYNNITLEKAQGMIDNKEYKESFSYAFHIVREMEHEQNTERPDAVKIEGALEELGYDKLKLANLLQKG